MFSTLILPSQIVRIYDISAMNKEKTYLFDMISEEGYKRGSYTSVSNLTSLLSFHTIIRTA